jgi:hypothetical protein
MIHNIPFIYNKYFLSDPLHPHPLKIKKTKTKTKNKYENKKQIIVGLRDVF